MSKSQVKRYYWIKLKEDFYDNDAIVWLERQHDGCKYINLYLKLLLKSINTGGRLVFKLGETIAPYDANDIAKITHMDVSTVIVGLDLLNRLGLIEQYEQCFTMPKLQELIGSETDWAEVKRRQREKRLISGTNLDK